MNKWTDLVKAELILLLFPEQITEYLEQRCYKELRHENFTLAKVVPCIYRKLLRSCKEHT